MDAIDLHKKECEEMKLAAMLWWLMIWHASGQGRAFRLPRESQWLSSELVAALQGDVTGDVYLYSWRHDASGDEHPHDWRDWPKDLNDDLDELERKFPHMFRSTIEGELRALMKRFVRYEFDGPDSDSELNRFHMNCTELSSGRSTFAPQREIFEQADTYLHRTQPSFEWWGIASEWCRTIGALMRPSIERDVVYIKKHYSW